eukprot:TRINITY_DN188_c2_g1_i1.p1 TRINITY_DN188_c2_g1~~TRINITY_DN188_c2_g1_i1.p1  ORF type:complete len:206 (+),score=56.75 TRINITY_DN188_c2_g1_i1:223-840(+)
MMDCTTRTVYASDSSADAESGDEMKMDQEVKRSKSITLGEAIPKLERNSPTLQTQNWNEIMPVSSQMINFNPLGKPILPIPVVSAPPILRSQSFPGYAHQYTPTSSPCLGSFLTNSPPVCSPYASPVPTPPPPPQQPSPRIVSQPSIFPAGFKLGGLKTQLDHQREVQRQIYAKEQQRSRSFSDVDAHPRTRSFTELPHKPIERM